MPIMNGQRVSLDEWRAAHNRTAATAPEVEATTEEVEAAPPKRRKRAAAAQVMAALGITPPTDEQPVEPVAIEVEQPVEAEVEPSDAQ